MDNYKSLNVINGVNHYPLNVLYYPSQFAIKKSHLLLLQQYISIYIKKKKKEKRIYSNGLTLKEKTSFIFKQFPL